MKKIALYMSLAVTGLFMAACNEDFKDWESQQTYSPESAITIPGFTASAAGAVDLNTAGDAVKVLSLSGSALPDGAYVDHIRFVATPEGGEEQTLNAVDTDGSFASSDLQELVVKTFNFGPRPTARTIDTHVYADVMIDGQAAFVDAGAVQLSITPQAPVIESAYYYVGATNGWSDSDQTYMFDNGGGDVYDNPEFTVTVPAPYDENGNRVDNWFKIAPASAYTSGDFWNNLVGVENNGDEATEGKIVVGKGFDVGAFNQPASDGATMYRITINMLDETYSITPITFKVEPAYYYVGATNGWSDSDKTYVFSNGGVSPLENPVYTCVVPAPFNEDGTRADNWFKIAPESAYTSGDFWNNLFGVVNDGDTSTSGELAFGNPGAFCQPASDGALYYRISINPKEMTYSILPMTFSQYVYFIGATDGWSASDQKLESPAGDGVYTGFVYVADPNGWGLEFKFQKRAGDWADDSQLNSNNLTTISGDFEKGSDNIKASAGEGVYYVTLDLTTNSLNAVKVEKMGIIGDFNGWGDDVLMTWNATDYCFEATNAGVNANGWKFRVNADWAINLGSNDSVEPSAVISDLVANGKNIGVVGSTIKLYPTRKTSDKIYCTVE